MRRSETLQGHPVTQVRARPHADLQIGRLAELQVQKIAAPAARERETEDGERKTENGKRVTHAGFPFRRRRVSTYPT
jgi:hypothetical protein